MTTQATNLQKLADELAWLQKHPEFDERPASIAEFLGPDYLNIESTVRASIRDELVKIFGDKVNGERLAKYSLAIFTGAIGIGKTTVASIILTYMAHWTLCLKDPQSYFGLMPGSRIAFMQMSTSEKQALDVVFGDIKARIKHSPWFEKYPYDPKYTNVLKFAKEIWIIPGDSAETTFEGYNILGGVLDEADSHKITDKKNYAEQGYDTIVNRISSRFQNRGFMIVVGQMKSAQGFAAQKYAEFKKRDDAHAVRMTIWESMGDDFYADEKGVVHKFAYDTYRKQIVPDGAAKLVASDNIIWIPEVYRFEFENNPEKALKDLAGAPPEVGDPFISLVDRIDECTDRWIASHNGLPSPVDPEGRFEPWFRAMDTLKRVVHIDIAYAADGDALGIAMGHISGMVEIEGELKPYIVIDALIRMTAPAGGEIFLADMRRTVYFMKDDLRFRIDRATLDGFQSQDTIQQFRRARISAEYLSIDRQLLPYYDLRDAIYERRIEIPPYLVKVKRGDTEVVDIAKRELRQLVDMGKKIDHPDGGSKDIADTLAGVTTTLMGDRRYHRKERTLPGHAPDTTTRAPVGAGMMGHGHPAFVGESSLRAPVPPNVGRVFR